MDTVPHCTLEIRVVSHVEALLIPAYATVVFIHVLDAFVDSRICGRYIHGYARCWSAVILWSWRSRRDGSHTLSR
jgi:hypothetical protein